MNRVQAQYYLDQAQELLEHDAEPQSVLEALDTAEEVSEQDTSVLFQSAEVLYRIALLQDKGQFLLLALDKLKQIEERDAAFFDQTAWPRKLWGDVLTQIGRRVGDASFFEMAIEKYEKVAGLNQKIDVQLYWDWGVAWVLLAQRSGEATDLQQSLGKFHIAEETGLKSPFFQIDYAHALAIYGQLKGDPRLMEQAIKRLHVVAEATYKVKGEPDAAYKAAWRMLAQTSRVRYFLSHHPEHLEESDRLIREAILAVPSEAGLWLEWAQLFLHAGWMQRDPKLLETGLEKLTASKIKECDPIRVIYLLGNTLLCLGLVLDSLKVLKDGSERVQLGLEELPGDPRFEYATGFADLTFGLYFSDSGAFEKAIGRLEKLADDPTYSVEVCHALFQAYLAWGLQEEDYELVSKGLMAIERVCSLRPHSPFYLNEWGVALLRVRRLENDKEGAHRCVEGAIALFQKAWELAEDDETLYNWGCAYDQLGDLTGDEEDYGKAVDLLSKVIDKKPSQPYVRYHLGLALSHLGELVQSADCLVGAIEFLEGVARSNPEDEEAWCELGYTLLNLAELIHDPIHPHEAEARRREAEKALLHAAELGSEDASYHLACLYSITGHYDVSLTYLYKAAASDRLPPIEELENDDWLEGIRQTEAFQDFLNMLGEDE